MRALINISLIVFALVASNVYAQVHTIKANECYKAKDYNCAQANIDSAITSSERFNSQTWQLRGLIYLKLEEAKGKDSRDIAIESFVQARNLDSTGVHTDKIANFIKNAVIRYYNDAVVYLEKGDLENSESSYVLYKGKFKKYLNPKQDFGQQDIEYYNALGSEYLKLVPRLSGDEKAKKVAKGIHFFELILKQDTTLFQPNFNVGIMYYNDGADLIMNMDPLTPIEEIPIIEERAQQGFRNALPFLHRAHRIEPERLDVIEAIAGCYYGLQDNDNYLKFQTILDKKNLPILLEKIQQSPKDEVVLQELCRIYSATLKDKEQYNKYLKILEELGE